MLWKYTLEDDSGIEARWSREAVSWTEALRGSAREESIKMFLGEDASAAGFPAAFGGLRELTVKHSSLPSRLGLQSVNQETGWG